MIADNEGLWVPPLAAAICSKHNLIKTLIVILNPPPPCSAVPEERKKLKVKDPERYHWRPRELIAQLARIHLNLYRTHPDQWAEVGGFF